MFSSSLKGKIRWPVVLIILCCVYAVFLILDSVHRYATGDEYSFLMNVINFYVYRTIVPVYANYPTFYSYLIFFPIFIVYAIFYFANGYPAEGFSDPFFFAFLFQAEMMNWIWVGRVISILAAVFTLYLTGRYLFKKLLWPAALFSLGLLMIDPFGVYFHNATFALPDIIIALLATIIVLTCFRCAEENDHDPLYRILFLVGLASCAKLNGLFTVLPVIFTFFLLGKSKNVFQIIGKGFLYLFAGVFIASPVLILKPQVYFSGFLTEAVILYNPNESLITFNEWIWFIKFLFQSNPLMVIVLMISILYSIYKHEKEDKIYHAFLFPTLIFLIGLNKHSLLYFIFLYPVSIIFIGRFCNDMLQKIDNNTGRVFLGIALLLVFLIFSSTFTSRLVNHAKVDNRTLAREWIMKNIKGKYPFLYDRADIPQIGAVTTINVLYQNFREDVVYQDILDKYEKKYPDYIPVSLARIQFDLNVINSNGPTYLVTSNHCYDFYLNKSGPSTISTYEIDPNRIMEKFLKMKMFYEDLFSGKSGYSLIKTFSDGSGPIINIFKKDKS